MPEPECDMDILHREASPPLLLLYSSHSSTRGPKSRQGVGIIMLFPLPVYDLHVVLRSFFQPPRQLSFKVFESHQPGQAAVIRSDQETAAQ